MAEPVTQVFTVYPKYWPVADRQAIAQAVADVLAERGIGVGRIRLTNLLRPERVEVECTNPARIEAIDHDTVLVKIRGSG